MRATVGAALVGLGLSSMLLTGCQLSGGGNTSELIVDFSNRLAASARDTVRTGCGDLPGISVVPPRKLDASVYFDISKASGKEVNGLANCVNNLSTTQPSLGIRGYRIDDGSMS